ncbi:MAG TPA: hypothetical protein VEI01_16545 [Terriglobales bacterium]|nr:hypothetical protein [Terriglobales bacterium]
MKLVVPYVGELAAEDARLIRLAEFLGMSCVPLQLANPAHQGIAYLERMVPKQPACFVVNPGVMQQWFDGDGFPPELVSFLVSRFPYLLIHAARPEPFHSSVIAAVSGGQLREVHRIGQSAQSYEIASEASDVCEAFAGLRFGPANPANDRVFSTGPVASGVRQVISIAGRPCMATMRREKSEIWFLAGEEVAPLDAEVGDAPLSEYFSRLLPYAMVLRHIFGEEGWRPSEPYASIIIDDPLLHEDYGFLNFQSLLGLMRRHNFHTTIAFIPHNFRRSSRPVTRMFRENANRFALCFHGNDHIGAEFASTDTTLLNTMLQIAERRMSQHQSMTGVDCDRVMVFPQGNFSVEAMSVLKSRNFDGAVNTISHPRQRAVSLTLAEIAQPAVLRYGDFPLFLRKDSLHTQSPDLAFNLFFGKPLLVVEHHDAFRHPEVLAEVASRINAVAPNVRWSNLANVVSNAILRRRTSDGVHQVRAYSRTVRVSNDCRSEERFLIEWKHSGQAASVEQVLHNGRPCLNVVADGAGVRLSVTLPPGRAHTFSVVHRNPHLHLGSLGLRRETQAFVRRRLSEVRDNYLSKSPRALAAAKTLQRCFPL